MVFMQIDAVFVIQNSVSLGKERNMVCPDSKALFFFTTLEEKCTFYDS